MSVLEAKKKVPTGNAIVRKMSVVEAKKIFPTINAIVKDALALIRQPMRTGTSLSADVALEQACTKAGIPCVELKEAINVILSARFGAWFTDSNVDADLCYEMGKCLSRDGADLPTCKAWLA